MKSLSRTHTLGICAMSKKVNAKHMQAIIENIKKFDEFKLVIFSEELIFNEDIINWPIVESMIVFFSTGFPFNKVSAYIKLRSPFLVNDFDSQKIFWDRREIKRKLKDNNIPTPESIIIDRGEIIDNDGDNYTDIKLNTTQERIEMIDEYFNNIEEILNNNINNYKKINKTDYEINTINNQIEQILSKNKNINNNINNVSEKNYDIDSLNSIDRNLSIGNVSKTKLSQTKSRISKSNSISKYSGSDNDDIYYFENEDSEEILETVNKNLKEYDEYIEYNKKKLYKPFIEKPANGDDHNIYIYYPNYGGQKRLFRKTKNLSSLYYPNINKIRRDNKSYIYEEFLQSDGFDIKVYTVGEDYFHAEERKAPTLDGLVQRSSEGKELRCPVNLTLEEKNIARKIVKIFKQNICGFDILRARGKSYVVDVNGWSFVKGNKKYYEDCAIQIRKIILSNIDKELLLLKEIKLPEIKIYEDMILENNKKGEKLKSIVGVFRHADRDTKQKFKFITSEPKILSLFDNYCNENIIILKDGKEYPIDLKLKKPQELLEIYNIVDGLLNNMAKEKINFSDDNMYLNYFQVKLILEKNLNFEGLTRKVQLRPQKWKKITEKNKTKYIIEEALFIIKWGGRITHSGIKQAKLLGKTVRKQIYSNGNKITWEDLLRLHSTYQHDLKCYSSEEGRNLKSAAAFLQGFLQLDGSLIPIISSMVRTDEKVSKLLDWRNANIEGLRKDVKIKLDEFFHYKGNSKEKYSEIIFEKYKIKNKNDKDDCQLNKIKKKQKHYFELIDDIGNFEKQMNEVLQLLGKFIKHLKSFLCTEEILGECDSYFVKNRNSIKNRKNGLTRMKSSFFNKKIKMQNIVIKRYNSAKKRKKKGKFKLEENKSEGNTFYLYDCEEEKVILIFKRYVKLYLNFFNKKTKKFNLGKIPEIYDNIKYDIIHNKSLINKDGYKLSNIVKKLAYFFMPSEYGITIDEKFNIGIKLIKPLLTKIKNDLLWMISAHNNKNEDFLQENKFNDLNNNNRLVKTRLYFTSQSHLYALFNTIIYGFDSFLVSDNNNTKNKNNIDDDVYKIFDLDYCSHIIFLLFENLNTKENDNKKYRIEIIISSGADKDPKSSNYEHMLSVNRWIVLNDHLTLDDITKYFNFVLNQ